MSEVSVFHGDSAEVLQAFAAESIDAVVTDPPYALVSIGKRFGAADAAPAKSDGATGVYARASAGFMGQRWDTGETAFSVAFWREVWRVLKPGGHVAAFGGSRTYHRLAVAIEDAGFEIRDMDIWAYGTGFPKADDVERAVARFMCAEPGRHYERELPPQAERRAGDHVCARCPEGEPFDGYATAQKPALEPICIARKPLRGPLGRNVLAHGCGGLNVRGCGRDGRWAANLIHDGSPEVAELLTIAGEEDDDPAVRRLSGARLFYSAKADAEDRIGTDHPTVKPVALMRWLVRLVCPPGGVVLDPFAGSGTTGLAALSEGFDAVLIEREARYVEQIRTRIAWARGEGPRLEEIVRAAELETHAARAHGADTPLLRAVS